jgi:hypothetical protein
MNTFEKIIKGFVEQLAQGDAVFASKYEKSGKDIEGCCRYIKSEARKQAQNGCAAIKDDEVFGWAVHYFDEGLKALKDSPRAEVKVAPTAEMPKKADSLANQKPKAKKGSDDGLMMSLFDFGEE